MRFPERVRVIRHQTLAECLEAYAREQDPFPMRGWEVDGTPYRIGRREFFANMNRRGRWGFSRVDGDRAEIHVWIDPEQPMSELVSLLGHEIGHIIRPYHRDDAREEAKAGTYDVCARLAFETAGHLNGDYPEGLEYAWQPLGGSEEA